MTTLPELQAQFRAFLLGGEDGIERLTEGSERLPARDRLAVYANAYRLRLREVLEEDFPGLHGVLGEQAFAALADTYVAAHPSDHPSVRWFGRRLPGFLRATEPYRNQPWLAQMAEFEWAQGEVMDAADSLALQVEDLGAIAPTAWPGLRLGFQSALRRRDLDWNVPALWQAIHDDQDPPPDPEPFETPVAWLLWRRELKVHWRSLEPDEHYALDAARQSLTFGEICEGLLARTRDDQVPRIAAAYLKQWIVDELVVRIE